MLGAVLYPTRNVSLQLDLLSDSAVSSKFIESQVERLPVPFSRMLNRMGARAKYSMISRDTELFGE